MRLRFENDLGTVAMSGGGDDGFRITKIGGLGVQAYERRTLNSYDFDGAVESARRFPQRNITIGGDVKGGRAAVLDMARILSEPCRMVISCEDFEREINVTSCETELADQNRAYTRFALSLTCDDPYFYDATETREGLYVRTKLITSDTVLPAVFSTRTDSAEIIVRGDREIEPTIVILGSERGSEEDGYIVIENTKAGTKFTFEYVPEEDELITIDVASRTITSDINGNIISYISDDSFLSDLVIPMEGAVFSTTGYGATGHINAYLIYKNRYIEAII